MTRSIGEYQPGVCNIGPAEVRRRRQAEYLGFGAAIVLGAALLLIDAPPVARLLIAVPLAGGLSGFLQARARFCANYGWRGIRNMGPIGAAERITDPEERSVDRRRSLRIVGASVLGGILVAMPFALLPS